MLSADKEERVELMVLLIRNLLKENKDLRDMAKNMASFVGEGLGSCLPRLGLTAPGLDAILNRADTDSAYDAFLAFKASREMEAANPGIALGEVRKRSGGAKRKHPSIDVLKSEPDRDTTSSVTPDNEPSNSGLRNSTFGTSTAVEDSNKKAKTEEPIDTSFLDTFGYLFPDYRPAQAVQAPVATPPSPLYGVPNMLGGGIPPATGQAPVANPGGSWPYTAPTLSQQAFLNRNENFSNTPIYQDSLLGAASQQGTVFSGFGLTVPAGSVPSMPFQPSMASLAGPGPSVTDYAAEHPAAARDTPPSNSKTPEEAETERQKHVRAAALKLTTSGLRRLDGAMTPEEVSKRSKLQQEVIHELEADLGHSRMIDAMQMITYHLNK